MVTATNDQTRLLNDVRMRLPGALDAAIQQELFLATGEFCKNTNVWREDIALPVVANTVTYTIAPAEAYAAINRLMWVLDNNKMPVAASMSVPGTLVLVNTPSQNDSWTVTVAKKPIDPADGNNFPQLPVWILDKYREDFQDGVLGRMMTQPAKPYTNPQMATYHMRRWRNAMAMARIEVQRTNGYRLQAWSFPQSFAVTPRRGFGGTSSSNPTTFR